jgi:hypothetical protein
LELHLARQKKPTHHAHGPKGSVETVRTEEDDGHRIVIRTTYQIEVDGKTLEVPLAVDNSGQVHCHSLPNYQFASAVDTIKTLIDIFPDDFPRKARRAKPSGAHGKSKH